jgi:two-component system, cell cycle response regulator
VARKHRDIQPSGFTILLVDDDADYLEATGRLLESEGHEILKASSGAEALRFLENRPVDLVLIDYFMPQMTGEEAVVRLREFNKTVQVILQTGYASERPPRDMLRRLDIQGYYDKSEGPERLLLWTDAGLKAADAIGRLERSRVGLRGILDASPILHRIQPLSDLYADIAKQSTELVGATSAFIAVFPESGAPSAANAPCIVLGEARPDDAVLIVQAQTGRFAENFENSGARDRETIAIIGSVLKSGTREQSRERTIMPLRVGDLTIGILWLEHGPPRQETGELLQVYANQATVAVQNMVLYEMAALDPLTGVHARRFFENWMRREVRTAFRSRMPVSLLMLDMDGLKEINDTAGHLVGDQALASVGKVLRMATRENDVVGRYGGDEFAVVLPQTGGDGAVRVGERLVELLRERTIMMPQGPRALSGSVGLATLLPHEFGGGGFERPILASYFQSTAMALLERADSALYVAKASGRDRVCTAESLEWDEPVLGSP